MYFRIAAPDAEQVVQTVFAKQYDYEEVKETFRAPATVAYHRETFDELASAPVAKPENQKHQSRNKISGEAQEYEQEPGIRKVE